jgi:hypothetical protein
MSTRGLTAIDFRGSIRTDRNPFELLEQEEVQLPIKYTRDELLDIRKKCQPLSLDKLAQIKKAVAAIKAAVVVSKENVVPNRHHKRKRHHSYHPPATEKSDKIDQWFKKRQDDYFRK